MESSIGDVINGDEGYFALLSRRYKLAFLADRFRPEGIEVFCSRDRIVKI